MPNLYYVSRSVSSKDVRLVKAEPSTSNAEPREYVYTVDGAGPHPDLNLIGADIGFRKITIGEDCLLYTSPSPRD